MVKICHRLTLPLLENALAGLSKARGRTAISIKRLFATQALIYQSKS